MKHFWVLGKFPPNLPNDFTLFENYSNFEFFHLGISTIFCPIKIDLSGNTVGQQVFKNLPKWNIFGIFNELLSTQNVWLASLAMVNETFSAIFKPM